MGMSGHHQQPKANKALVATAHSRLSCQGVLHSPSPQLRRLPEENMKRRQMNSLAHSLCGYLCSRNNDISGYWGIGILCSEAKRDKRKRLSFKIRPGEQISIYGHLISESSEITEKLVTCDLDSIEGRISFFNDGRYPDGTERYTCGVAIAITQGSRTGMSMSHVSCWPHDRSRESRRAAAAAYRLSLMERLKLHLE